MTPATDAPAHEGAITLGAACNVGTGAPPALLRANFVRYPGCQQLQLWLPPSGGQGYTRLRVRQADGRLLLDTTVQHCVQGSVQILFDTLHWPPGALQLEIDHAEGWRHCLPLHKSHDGTPPTLPQPAAQADPGEDLRLRAQALQDLARRLAPEAGEDPTRFHR
ncbi:MAG: hypothetical protein HY855_16550 [Burkholderiales bacterium]|nr:hypothetical protein [Burkholderiales bacterium]